MNNKRRNEIMLLVKLYGKRVPQYEPEILSDIKLAYMYTMYLLSNMSAVANEAFKNDCICEFIGPLDNPYKCDMIYAIDMLGRYYLDLNYDWTHPMSYRRANDSKFNEAHKGRFLTDTCNCSYCSVNGKTRHTRTYIKHRYIDLDVLEKMNDGGP